MHPHEHRLTRRNLVRGAIGAGAAAGVAGVAAGCANTTTAVGSGAGGGNPAVQKFVVPKPTGPSGLPLPRTDNSITWAITDDNPPIKEGLQPEGGRSTSTTTPTTSGRASSSASRSNSSAR